MAKTDLRVTIDADAAKLEREIHRASRSMDQLEREISKGNRESAKFEKQLNDRTAKALENSGRRMVAFGAATLAGLGLATKAAIDWESQWTGVLKTVDGSSKQLAKLEGDLRSLATSMPATHQEIAAVAEAAGQLGVATPDVARFTKVMIDLGETTNLSADEAATAIAQLMNIMQSAPGDVDNLGSVLVELGNNGASTERDIISMAQRIAGAGAIVGMSEAEVLAMANALASVGIEAEAGGSSISTAMIKMADAVAKGGDSVSGFAETAGMSSQEFVQAFERDPAQAINAFTQGLGRIDAAGGNVFAVLDDLGLGSIRTRDALLRLAGSGDLLSKSLDDGNRAWQENRALIEEAEKRYDTAEAKISIAKNAVVDLAIDIGSVLLPVLATMAEGVADIAKWFSDLPGPIKTVAVVLAALAGTAALLGGGFLLLAPRLAAARAEIALLSVTAPRAAMAMRAFTLAIPVVGILLAVAGGIATIATATNDAGPSISTATEALLKLGDGISTGLIDKIVYAVSAVGSLDIPLKDFGNDVKALDTALAEMVTSGNADEAKQDFNALAKELEREGVSIEDLRKKFPAYAEALKKSATDHDLLASKADKTGMVLDATTGEIIDQTEALKKEIDLLQESGLLTLSLRGAQRKLAGAVDDANSAIRENGKGLNINTRRGRENQAALDEIADSAHDLADAQIDAGKSGDVVSASMRRARKQFIETAIKAGHTREEARKLADKLGLIPGDYLAVIKTRGADNAKNKINDIAAAIRNLPADTQLQVAANFTGVNLRAAGGYIAGPGGPTEDKAGLFALSNGEYVMKAASVRKYGRKRFEAMNAGIAPAEGGPASRVTIKASTSGADQLKNAATDFADKAARSYSTASGKVLPPGRYTIGRGPEGHGYNARDLPAATGTPIFSAAAGMVSSALRLATSYGIHAKIQHAGFRTLYAHMSQMFVRAGQSVNQGQMIGRVGSTGNSTGPHLHLEPDNPRFYHNGGVVPGPRGRTTPIMAAGGEGVFTPDQMAAMGGRGGASGGPDADVKQLGTALGRAFVRKVIADRSQIRSVFSDIFNIISQIDKKSLRVATRRRAINYREGLLKWGAQLERIGNRLDAARDKLKQLNADARSLRESTRESVARAEIINPELGQIAGRSGALDVSGTTTFASIKAQLAKELDQANKFASTVYRLRKAGLNKNLLQQLISAGPEEGLASAQQILQSGKAGIKQVNSLQYKLQVAGDKIGRTAANNMYRQGIQAANGLIRGLVRREGAIERTMRRIARSMVRAIKRQLRMASPSRVMEGLGHDTASGFAVGLDKDRRLVERSASDLAKAAEAGASRYLVGAQNRQYSTPMASAHSGGVMEFRHVFEARGGAARSDVDRWNYLLMTGQLNIKTEAIRR